MVGALAWAAGDTAAVPNDEAAITFRTPMDVTAALNWAKNRGLQPTQLISEDTDASGETIELGYTVQDNTFPVNSNDERSIYLQETAQFLSGLRSDMIDAAAQGGLGSDASRGPETN